MKKIKNILSRLFSGSRIARMIYLLFISMGVVMTVAFLIIFLLYNKKIMDEAGTKSMNDLSTRCAEDIQHEMSVYLGQTMSIVTAQTMSVHGALSGQLRRDDINAILKGYFRHTDVLVGGVKWEPNAFDGADDQYKDDPLFSAYNGELNIFFVREDSTTIVHKPNYQLDPALYNQIRKNPVGQIMHAEFITVAGKRVLALPLAMPFIARDRKTFLGAFVEYIPVTKFNAIARKFKEQTDIEMAEVIFDNNFTIIADAQNPGNNGKRLGEVYGKPSEHPEVFNSPESHLVDELGISHHANVLQCGGGDNKWTVLFSTYTYNFSKNLYEQLRTFAIIAFVLLLITLVIATIIGNKIGRPISQMIQGCRQIAKGNINVSFNHKDIKGSTEISELFSAFDDMAKNIRRIVSDVKQSAQNVNSAGKELSKSASMMAQGANQQASASEQVSTAMDEMTASIQKNAVNAKETEDITNKVVQSVQIANKSVGTTAEAMKNITNKIGIINEIAGRTDLLAVNAAIEAARVGELGKGFAVVASEIRKLAERCQAAAQEIDTLTANGVKQAENSGRLLEMLVPEINKTSQLVHEITSASVEQNCNAAQVNNAILQLNNITQQNAATAEELSTSADESQSQAELLDSTMDFFKLDSTTTISEIATLNREAEAILKRIDELKQQQKNNL